MQQQVLLNNGQQPILLNNGQQLPPQAMQFAWQQGNPFQMQMQMPMQPMQAFNPLRPPPPMNHHGGRPPEDHGPRKVVLQLTSLPDWCQRRPPAPIIVPMGSTVPLGATVPQGVEPTAAMAARGGPPGNLPIGTSPGPPVLTPYGNLPIGISPGPPILTPYGNLPDTPLARLILEPLTPPVGQATVPQSGTPQIPPTMVNGAPQAVTNSQPGGTNLNVKPTPPSGNCQPAGVSSVNVKPKITQTSPQAQASAVTNTVQPAGTKENQPIGPNEPNRAQTMSKEVPAVRNEGPAGRSQEPAVTKEAGTNNDAVRIETGSKEAAVTNTSPAGRTERPAVTKETDQNANIVTEAKKSLPTSTSPAVTNDEAGRKTPAVNSESAGRRSSLIVTTPTVSKESPAASKESAGRKTPQAVTTPTVTKESQAVTKEAPAVTKGVPAVTNEPAGRKTPPAAPKRPVPPPLPQRKTLPQVPPLPKAKKENQPVVSKEKDQATVTKEAVTKEAGRSTPYSPVERDILRPDGIVDPRRIKRELVAQKDQKQEKKKAKKEFPEEEQKKPTWDDLFGEDPPARIQKTKRRRPVDSSDSEEDTKRKRRDQDTELPSITRETIIRQTIEGDKVIREEITRETFYLPTTPPSSIHTRSSFGSPRSDAQSLPSFGSYYASPVEVHEFKPGTGDDTETLPALLSDQNLGEDEPMDFQEPRIPSRNSRRVHFEKEPTRIAERQNAPLQPKKEAVDISPLYQPNHHCVGHDCEVCEERDLLETLHIAST